MKKLLLTSFAAAFLLQAKAQTFSHSIVPVTGFTADVIADGSGSASSSTTDNVDGGNYNFVAQNFVNPSSQSPTTYLPGSGLINSAVTPGLPFQLASYSGNNSLRLTTTNNSGTLTFTTPRTADKVNLLVTSAYSAAFTATVNFTDATSQAFTNNTSPNWFDGANPAIQGIGRVQRVTNAIENLPINPRLYEFGFMLSAANAAKTIQSITITKTTPAVNEILHVFAVTASTVLANDAGVAAIISPTSPVSPGVSQPVTVTIKNYGSSPLTSAILGFSVDGTTVVNNFAFVAPTGLATNAVSSPISLGNYTFPAGNFNLSVCTKLPNGVVDPNPVNDCQALTVISCNPLAGAFTINKNIAASATNFVSFASAVNTLTSCGISGPVTLTVAPNTGPYNEQVTLPVITGTSATSMVTFEGNGNTLTAATTAAKQGVIIFNGADFVKVNNLNINVNATAPAGWGVQLINASDNDIISNCTINLPLGSTSDVYNGIIAGVSTSATGNNANNLLLQNNIINGGYNGVMINGTAATTGNRIIGNQIRDPHVYGINITSGGTGTIIESNDISRPTRTNAGVMYGVFLVGSTTNTIVSKNRIHNTHDVAGTTSGTVWGIYTTAATTLGNENIIKNNLFYNINNAGGIYYAFYNTDAHGTYYYHNTVSANNPAISFSYLRGLHLAGMPNNVKFINNIVSLTSPATNKHAIYLGTSNALVSNGNDLYVGNSGNIGFFSSSDRATLSDWQTANGGAYDQNSISVDPVFANPSTNLQPLATALNNAGRPLPAVTDDINGVIRSTTTPDMGAYEFTPAANDAGITAIVSPTSPVTPGIQAVQVTLKNFGTATLNSAIIGWKVNGVAQSDFNWTGSLSNLQSIAMPINIGSYNFATGNYTIKVWAKSPNGTSDAIAANDTTILKVVSCAALVGNYTINKNNPSAGTNFQSITEAVQRLSSCGVSAPVTITVTSGTGPYNEQVEIGNIPNANVTNTVTFEGSGNTVSITPVGKPGIFVLNGAKYVKLNNFVITLAAGATTGWGVQLLNGADYNTISNNTINLPLSSTALDVNGIVSGNTTTTAGNHANNCKFQNNIINGGYHGIRLNGVSGGLNAINNQITGNQIKDSYQYGVYLGNASGTLIEGNDISRPARINGGAFTGIQLASGTCNNTIISKNRIHNTHDVATITTGAVYGIYINAFTTAGNENIIKNNLIYNLNNTNGNVYALYNAGGHGAYFYYNTVATDPAATYNILRGITIASAVVDVKFINNIISMPSPAITKHLYYVGNTSITLTSNNNVLYPGTTGNIGFYSTDKATLTDWKAVNSNAYDQNSVSVDPVFISTSTGNLKPTFGVLNNIGQAVATVTDDFAGITRNLTTPDPGAYEFSPASDDAGIVAVSNPNITGCNLSSTEAITVTIKNYGTNTLTSIPVTYSVNNVAIAAPETFTGSIAPNATATFTFTTKANLAAQGSYVIVAKTLLSGDIFTINDTDTMRVTNSMVAGTPAPFNFETAATGIAKFRKVTNPKSKIIEGAGASFGTGSTKGMIMEGANNINWVTPIGTVDPWTSNAENFAGAYICISPANFTSPDSLWMTFDLKQLFIAANANTNFRVMLNGAQVGPTYRPPFAGTPINWQKVKINLTAYKNDPTLQIGLESNVREAYSNGLGTANLIDNITFQRRIINGLKTDELLSQVHVFPNPGNGQFNIDLPKGKSYELVVTDLTGKVLKKQTANGGNNQLNLEGTAKGIYLLKVSGENGSAIRKLIVE